MCMSGASICAEIDVYPLSIREALQSECQVLNRGPCGLRGPLVLVMMPYDFTFEEYKN